MKNTCTKLRFIRLLTAGLALLFLLGGNISPVYAQDSVPEVHVTEACMIMSLPSTSSVIAGMAWTDDWFPYRCTVADADGNTWYEAKLGSGRIGYLPTDCCSYDGEDSWSAGVMQDGTKLILECLNDIAIIRAEPNGTSEIVAYGKEGERMEYLGCTTEPLGMELYKVRLSNGDIGYIRSLFCTVVEEESPAAEMTAGTNRHFTHRIHPIPREMTK